MNLKLAEIDITVPPRHEGRTTEDRERWSILRFLATLNQQERIDFPLSLTKRERPDFHIRIAGRDWGVEITEAIPTDYAKALAIAANLDPDVVIDRSLFKFGEKKSIEEILEIIESSKLTDCSWVSEHAAQDFASAIQTIVSNKTEKFRKAGFEKFQTNILLIYENMPVPKLERRSALTFTTDILEPYWQEEERFDYVYIESGEAMLCLHQGGHELIRINNLW
ncbi:MAG: hypothetical protein MI754_06555 [Chromatiales bacterium]|nr:hypothetical protein [Chromatiales bacterium]